MSYFAAMLLGHIAHPIPAATVSTTPVKVIRQRNGNRVTAAEIVEAVRAGCCDVTQIAERLEISRNAVLAHLTRIEKTGVIAVDRKPKPQPICVRVIV
jgi:DNA-binding transcriptional ArsR family regulator